MRTMDDPPGSGGGDSHGGPTSVTGSDMAGDVVTDAAPGRVATVPDDVLPGGPDRGGDESAPTGVGTDTWLSPTPPRRRPILPAWVPEPLRDPLTVFGFLVLAAGVITVFFQMHPDLIFSRTTPTGGDMGAHVFTPDFVRRQLFPHFRLWGWTDSSYAGFPVLGFYFPFPSLLIAALTALHVLPYQMAFKLVTVLGILGLPIATWAFGRLARLPRPLPLLLGLAAFPFLFDRQWTIYGGNIASTMAGEFSFSISLTLGVLFLGVLVHVLLTGQKRGWAAVLLALTGLCHLLPTIFVLVTSVLLVLVLQSPGRALRKLAWQVNGAIVGGLVVAAVVFEAFGKTAGGLVAVLVLAAAMVAGLLLDLRGVRLQTLDAALVLGTGGALAGFWLLPFYKHLDYSNDMGWEKVTQYVANLFPFWAKKPPAGAGVAGAALCFAAIGALWILLRLWGSLVDRRMPELVDRIGAVLLGVGAIAGLLFRFIPQFRLWNARVLPFWFLAVYLLAAFGFYAIGASLTTFARWLSNGQRHWRHASLGGAVLATFLVWLAVGVPLELVPGWMPIPKVQKGLVGVQTADETVDRSFAPGWASWNFKGYEQKGSWAEYSALMRTSIDLGKRNGCGRAMWDYEGGLDRFGTPMGLMLLPYWTKGCIGSMEAVYFESSATTPYHFMNAAYLSNSPSNPQRDLPYPTFDLNKGIEKLQQFGVRYYYTFSGRGQQAARANPNLRLVATSTPLTRSCPDAEKTAYGCPTQWEIYEIAHSELVTPLTLQPAVVKGVGQAQHNGWLDMAITQYLRPETFPVPLTATGPKDWERVQVTVDTKTASSGARRLYGDGTTIAQAKQVPEPSVAVSDIRHGEDWIKFHVDKPGVPVLVKISYFPNWKAKGAKGPYRVAPNFMVVIPTKNEVSLRFSNRWPEYLGWLATFGGIGAVVLYGVLERRRRTRVGVDAVVPGWTGGASHAPHDGIDQVDLPAGMPGLLAMDDDQDEADGPGTATDRAGGTDGTSETS